MLLTSLNHARLLALVCCHVFVSGAVLFSQINVRLPEVTTRPGSSVLIPVRVDDLTGKNVTAFELVIACDTSVVKLKGVEQEGTLSEGLTMFANNRVSPYSAGKMKIVCASAKPISGKGVLVKILADVGKKGKSTLVLSNVVLNAGEPLAHAESGVLSVLARRGEKSATGK